MNSSILYRSFDYLTEFTSVVLLSKNIYKHLKSKIYTDLKFKNAFIVMDTEMVVYLSKYVIHKDILSLNDLYYKIDYNMLCIFKQLNLCIINEPENLILIEPLHSPDLFEFLIYNNFETVQMYTSRIIYFIMGKLDKNDADTLRYINIIKQMIISFGTDLFHFNILCQELFGCQKIQIDNYSLVHFIMQQNNRLHINNFIKHACFLNKDIIAINIISSYGKFELRKSYIKELVLIDCKRLEYLIKKGFIIKFSTNILKIALKRNVFSSAEIILQNRNFEFDRYEVIAFCKTIPKIHLLAKYDFNFSSDIDDAYVYYLKEHRYNLINHLVNMGIKVNNINTYRSISRLCLTTYKSMWSICDDANILLMLIEESRYKILKYLVQERNLTHPDAYDLAKKLNKTRICKLLK